MSWFEKLVPQINANGPRKAIPEGLWSQCKSCNEVLYRAELERHLLVCPKCHHHMPIHARQRLELFFDADSTTEIAAHIKPLDPLKFKDTKKYRDRLLAAQKNTGETDALVCMSGTVKGLALVAVAFDFRFLGGSMGSVVGEKFVQAARYAIEKKVPFVCFCTSGGARMQEALHSLFQMAKTSAALTLLTQQGLPYISVMTHPTTGGVSASLAMLGDINLAEPGALIGFAGPRVIEETTKTTLPAGFQRSEFLLEHGQLDQIVDRREMRDRLHTLLSLLTSNTKTAVDSTAS